MTVLTFDPTMCAKQREYCFFAEYLPRVSAYQISFSTRESCKLSFSKRRVWLTRDAPEAAKEEEIFQWPPHLPELDPASHLQYNKSTPSTGPLQLRFKSHGPNSLAGSKFESELDPPEILPTSQIIIVIKCGFCFHSISGKPNYYFKRVLPLPSEDWTELVNDAFCHFHQHTSPSPSPSPSSPHHQPHTLTPREGDCLIGRDVVCVRGDCVISDAIILCEEVFMCRRCYSVLGHTTAANEKREEEEITNKICDITLEFIRSQISLEISPSLKGSPSSVSPPRPTSPSHPPSSHPPSTLILYPSFSGCSVLEKEAHLASKLYSTAKQTTSYKLRIKDRSGHTYLHVWMLNVISHVTSNTYHVTSKEFSSKFSGLCSPSSSPSHHPITHHPALKLLYVVAMDTDRAPWSRDTEEPLPLTEEECLWLCVLLVQSTLSLPPTQRTARELNVGYLCVE